MIEWLIQLTFFSESLKVQGNVDSGRYWPESTLNDIPPLVVFCTSTSGVSGSSLSRDWPWTSGFKCVNFFLVFNSSLLFLHTSHCFWGVPRLKFLLSAAPCIFFSKSLVSLADLSLVWKSDSKSWIASANFVPQCFWYSACFPNTFVWLMLMASPLCKQPQRPRCLSW